MPKYDICDQKPIMRVSAVLEDLKSQAAPLHCTNGVRLKVQTDACSKMLVEHDYFCCYPLAKA